jgi:hypothetical protein
MGYFEMNLNMAIAFRVNLSYNFDPLYDYFNQEFIYYISEKYIIKFQSNIGLICGRDHFYYYVKHERKNRNLCALIFFKHSLKSY